MSPEKFPTVDGLEIIEQYLLFKGEQVAYEFKGKMAVEFTRLVDMALVHYNLKVNATNKLKVRFDLEKYFMRRNMIDKDNIILFPKTLYIKVAEINSKYRNETNLSIE